MHQTSYRTSQKRAARLRRKMAERQVTEQIERYNKLVNAGIKIAQLWAIAATIIPEHIKVLSALLAFVDASNFSNKDKKAKTDAIGLALRAAYLLGKFNGELPEPPEVPDATAVEEAQETDQ